jgi:hypothetical protein
VRVVGAVADGVGVIIIIIVDAMLPSAAGASPSSGSTIARMNATVTGGTASSPAGTPRTTSCAPSGRAPSPACSWGERGAAGSADSEEVGG